MKSIKKYKELGHNGRLGPHLFGLRRLVRRGPHCRAGRQGAQLLLATAFAATAVAAGGHLIPAALPPRSGNQDRNHLGPVHAA